MSPLSFAVVLVALGVHQDQAPREPSPTPDRARASAGSRAPAPGPAKLDEGPPNGADRIVFWVAAEEVARLSDAELDRWKARGVGGFFCMTRHLPGMGGVQRFTGDPEADLAEKEFALQRTLRDSKIAARARARGMKMYLGCYLVNYWNTATPLKDWFDDAGWADEAVPRVGDLAAAAQRLGFDGIAFDQELYPQSGHATTATWSWGYPGNTHTEPEVRTRARERGRQLMRALVAAFPQLEIAVSVDPGLESERGVRG